MSYLKSSQVHVFPCAYRGTSAAEQLDSATVIDSESRVFSEYNLTHLSSRVVPGFTEDVEGLRSANSYIITFKEDDYIECVISGYFFRVTFDGTLFGPNTFFVIDTYQTLIDDTREYTYLLKNLNNSSDLYLDFDNNGTKNFAGLLVTTSIADLQNLKYLKITNDSPAGNVVEQRNVVADKLISDITSEEQGKITIHYGDSNTKEVELAELTPGSSPEFDSIRTDTITSSGSELTINQVKISNTGEIKDKDNNSIKSVQPNASGATPTTLRSVKFGTGTDYYILDYSRLDPNVTPPAGVTPTQLNNFRLTTTTSNATQTVRYFTIPSGGGSASVDPNPSGTVTASLNKIGINGVVYGVLDNISDKIEANAGGSATTNLNTLRINNTVYSIPSSGGSSGITHLDPYPDKVHFTRNSGSESRPDFCVEGYAKFKSDAQILGSLECPDLLVNKINVSNLIDTNKLNVLDSLSSNNVTVAGTLKANGSLITSGASEFNGVSIFNKNVSFNGDVTISSSKELNVNGTANFKKKVVFSSNTTDSSLTSPDVEIKGGLLLSRTITSPSMNNPVCLKSNSTIRSKYVYCELGFQNNSDKRLKENLRLYETDKSILDLPVYKFDFINGPKNQIGCIAQDLQAICPELVEEGPDGMLGIQETKLVYLLLEEVKKLRKEVDELKNK